ncbi:PAS domain S-box protein [Thermodesulfobacteriota bacterium]
MPSEQPPNNGTDDTQESEIRIRHDILFNYVPMGILVYSERGEVIEANQFLLDLLGSPSIEATKQIDLFSFKRLREAGIAQLLQGVVQTGMAQRFCTPYFSKWGKACSLHVMAFPLTPDASHNRKGMVVIQDLTPLTDREEDFKHLVEKIPLAIAITDETGRFGYINPMFSNLFERRVVRSSSVQRWLDETFPNPEERDRAAGITRYPVDDSNGTSLGTFSIDTKDGTSKRIHLTGFSIGEKKRVLICEDISELVLALEKVRSSREITANVVEYLTDFVYSLDTEGTLLSINTAAARTLGYEPEDLIGQSIERIVPAPVRKYIPSNMKRLKDKGVADGISQYIGKDGQVRYLEYRSQLIQDEDGPSYAIGVARDVTDRVIARRALKESEARFRVFVENAHDGIVFVQSDMKIEFANPRMKALLKDPQPEGKPLESYFDERNAKILENHLSKRVKGESSTYYITLRDVEGNSRQMVVSGAPYFDSDRKMKGAVGVYTDISELRALEDQLQQAQKMEAVGTLAGGIAHDFNNMLSGVLGYASLIKRLVPEDSPVGKYADMITKSATRGAALSSQLLAFARKSRRIVTDVDSHQLIDDVVDILARTLDRKITVSTRKDAISGLIEGDPGQILQLLMNLCINAKDAMPDGGRLTIATSLKEIDQHFSCGNMGIAPGRYFVITVEDTGEGMNKEVKERLFEPFFTTKEDGKGTGLGLSMVYATVKSHDGHVKVYSEPGHGTAFSVLLPVKAERATIMRKKTKKQVISGDGTILLVDDEEMVRLVLSDMLKELGFNVLVACDGAEGVSVYRENCNDIDLVILDMIMPKLNGREAFKEMKKINPGVKAILSTGYSQEYAVGDDTVDGIVGFVQKPYNLDQLSEALSEALVRS